MSLPKLLKELEAQGKIKKQKTDETYLNGLLHAASVNFEAATSNLNHYNEVAFKAAYDGLLQISRVILLINGYRPHDGEQHKTTFIVAGAFLGDEFKELISKIDKYRKRRNECIYNPIDMISEKEAASILETSKKYQKAVSHYLKGFKMQLELFNE